MSGPPESPWWNVTFVYYFFITYLSDKREFLRAFCERPHAPTLGEQLIDDTVAKSFCIFEVLI